MTVAFPTLRNPLFINQAPTYLSNSVGIVLVHVVHVLVRMYVSLLNQPPTHAFSMRLHCSWSDSHLLDSKAV